MTLHKNSVKLGTKAFAAGTTIACCGGYFVYYSYSDEGTRRALSFYQTFLPVVLQYRWAEAWHGKDADWDALDAKYAQSTVQKLGELQGMYCKYGQTAAGFTNTFGEKWIREFRTLENQVPPRPVECVWKTIQEETGKPVQETFAEFDPIPLGSASIGQVHRAKCRDGTQVAVKVQYAEAQQLFQEDIHTIRSFCETFAPEHVVLLDAIQKQNQAELDYHKEAANLWEVSQNMKRHGFDREVKVPVPISDLTTSRMLVMELLPGPKLSDGIRDYIATWAEQNGTSLQALEEEARQKMEQGIIPIKDYKGPSAFQISLYRNYLGVRDALSNSAIGVYNVVGTGWLFGAAPLPYQQSSLPPNVPRMIGTLMKVHGYQLLQDGVFNADPHGGNFVLMPDGRIGMIDYGATKRFSRNERLTVCLIYAALARKDPNRLFDLCQVGGYKSKYSNREVLYKLIQFGYDSWGKEVTGDQNIQQFIDDLKQTDPWEEVPDNFTMAKLMSIRLRALAFGMNHPVKCSDWWGPIAEEILNKEGLPYDSWTYEMLVEYKPEMNIQKYKFA